MHYIRRVFLIVAIFVVGFGTSKFLSSTTKIKTAKPIEISKEATTTASLLTLPNTQLSRVTRVIDGDTIEIEGGAHVRYIGIDTPETVSPQKPVQCFGSQASQENKRLVEGKVVRLEKDISETDKYGRLLRYIYVDDIFINDYLVRQGFAHASTYPPDVKYIQQFLEAQREAQQEGRGLWTSCTDLMNASTSASVLHASKENPASASPVGGCTIKGNISVNGEKIYHVSGCGSYDKTVIDENAGEKWFCSENEAVAAGWRKAKNCP